jgi:hypothetical protein
LVTSDFVNDPLVATTTKVECLRQALAVSGPDPCQSLSAARIQYISHAVGSSQGGNPQAANFHRSCAHAAFHGPVEACHLADRGASSDTHTAFQDLFWAGILTGLVRSVCVWPYFVISNTKVVDDRSGNNGNLRITGCESDPFFFEIADYAAGCIQPERAAAGK